jgi:hypothetical protein
LLAAAVFLLAPSSGWADHPFFVTYTTHMEEPWTLEIEARNVAGNPKGGNAFAATALEFEYGATTFWTTELYLDGQTTKNESTIYTGFRWENRIRLLPHEYWITPVLYIEYENLSGADKTLLEIVGHDVVEDLTVPNSEARQFTKRELELKLILSSYHRGWSISENLIAEKMLNHPESWEFGYAIGAYRPLALKARVARCGFCPERILAGVEVYGGLGTVRRFGLQETSHYVAPTVAWNAPHGILIKLSPGFGLNGTSAGFLLRFGASFEFEQFGSKVKRFLSGNNP